MFLWIFKAFHGYPIVNLVKSRFSSITFSPINYLNDCEKIIDQSIIQLTGHATLSARTRADPCKVCSMQKVHLNRGRSTFLVSSKIGEKR